MRVRERERDSKENNDEFREKKAQEEKKKESEKGDAIIKYPKLEITVTSAKNPNEERLITVTPNSINGCIKPIGYKFYFGKEDKYSNKKNDYNFNDETVGARQFEISFNQDKNKFFIVDNKRGTGLFVKIKNKIAVDHDMIVSFCASHMILQTEIDRNNKNK
jgi:hypothetical protein